MNNLGKTLVLINLVLSILLLSWAALLVLHPVDWGWAEPRKAFGSAGEKKDNERIASKIDERIAAYSKFHEAKQLALPNVQPAQDRLNQSAHYLGFNRRLYRAELARLDRPNIPAQDLALAAVLTGAKKPPAQFEVRSVKLDPKGQLALQPDQPWGHPVLDKVVLVEVFTAAGKPDKAKIEKPYSVYLTELADRMREVREVSLRITGDEKAKQEGLTQKLKKQTVWLNGLFDEKDGKLLEPGLYQLLDMETDLQRKVLAELEALQPLWVSELRNADQLRLRRQSLEKRLIELGVNPSEVVGQ